MLWDTENRLTSVTNSGVTETYGYAADGERITRTTGGVTTVYLGGLWEETSAGAVKQYYAFNGTVVVVRDSSAGVSYLHGDHLGSVSATTGAQPGPQTYGPWGNVTSGGSSATARTYTGQYLDSASGLLYYHARYYDATLARFISADTVVPGQSDKAGTANPQALNRYLYVTNNPLTYTDPSGHAQQVPIDEGGGESGGWGCSGACGGSDGGGSEGGGAGEPIEPSTNVTPPTTQMGPEGSSSETGQVEPAVEAPQPGTYEHARRLLGFDPKDSPAKEPYERPSPTYQEQKAVKQAVRGQPCINCGTIEESASHQVANHDPPLAVEYYRNGSIDRANAFSTSRINSMCRICSAKEGYEIKAFIQFMNRLLFGGNK